MGRIAGRAGSYVGSFSSSIASFVAAVSPFRGMLVWLGPGLIDLSLYSAAVLLILPSIGGSVGFFLLSFGPLPGSSAALLAARPFTVRGS